jgi:hypothetical protein
MTNRASMIVALYVAIAGCHSSVSPHDNAPAIVGTWVVSASKAPFPMHLFAFHSDGIVQQSNPDAGDPNTSDSSAMGVWVADGDEIRGKIVEVTADRKTRRFVSRGDISFTLKVTGDAFRGEASAMFYNAAGGKLRGPVTTPMTGRRVTP